MGSMMGALPGALQQLGGPMTAQQIRTRGQAAGWQPGQNAPHWYANQIRQGNDPFGESAAFQQRAGGGSMGLQPPGGGATGMQPGAQVLPVQQQATPQQMAMKDAMNRQNSMQPMHVAQQQAMGMQGPSWLNGMQPGAQAQGGRMGAAPGGQPAPRGGGKSVPAAPPFMR